MTEQDPDLLADDNLDGLRGRNPYPPMSDRFRLTELLENARYQNNLLAQKCRELEKERDDARRLLCEKIAYCCDSSGRIPREIAEEMGWGDLKWAR